MFAEYPRNKSKWRNKKSGSIYVIIRTMNTQANTEKKEKFPIYVGYEDCSGRSWCRPIKSFLDSFEPWLNR